MFDGAVRKKVCGGYKWDLSRGRLGRCLPSTQNIFERMIVNRGHCNDPKRKQKERVVFIVLFLIPDHGVVVVL